MLNLSYIFYSSDKNSEIVAVTGGAPVLLSSQVHLRRFNKSSSDDRPGPGICSCKYVEDVKAARSVRVWDRVPIKKQSRAWSSQVLLRVSTLTIFRVQAITFIHFYSLRKRFITVTRYGCRTARWAAFCATTFLPSSTESGA